MKRHLFSFAACTKFAACTVVLSAFMLPTARADEEFSDPFAAELAAPPALAFEEATVEASAETNVVPSLYAPPEVPAQPAILQQSGLMQQVAPQPVGAGAGMMVPQGPQQQQGYVRLNAPLYPSPKPNIPIWTGSTVITNQAFAPHEMLYPHTYKAIYPPFYHKVKGGWIVTPFGVRSHERWELQGTQVQVKYRSQQPGWFH